MFQCSSNLSPCTHKHKPSYVDISERQDNEIAQEIQEELVRQAEQQRQQEVKDAVRNAHTHTNMSANTSVMLVTSINDLTSSIDVLQWVGHST